MPLRTNTKDRHIIDRSIRLTETLTSVYDRGKWIANIDILKAICKDDKFKHSQVYRANCKSIQGSLGSIPLPCENPAFTYQEALAICPSLTATRIDNWDELLDPPDSGTMVVRALKNWWLDLH